MEAGIGVFGLYVRDQDEALAFYVDKLGFEVHTDTGKKAAYRWLTVTPPKQPGFQLGLFKPGPPVHDADTAASLEALVARGAMPPLVLYVDDCRAEHDRLVALGVDVTQAPVERFGNVDCGIRDPSGNAWKLITRGR